MFASLRTWLDTLAGWPKLVRSAENGVAIRPAGLEAPEQIEEWNDQVLCSRR